MLDKITKYWIPIFLFLLGLFFFIRSFSHADEFQYRSLYVIPCSNEYIYQSCPHKYYAGAYEDYVKGKNGNPTKNQRARWQEEYEFHMFHAIRTYNEAKDRCWWLPNTSEREKARMCWTTAISMVAAPTPQLKIVVTVTQLLTQYGLDCIDEWYYIQEKLHWSEFHFNECLKYQELLQK